MEWTLSTLLFSQLLKLVPTEVLRAGSTSPLENIWCVDYGTTRGGVPSDSKPLKDPPEGDYRVVRLGLIKRPRLLFVGLPPLDIDSPVFMSSERRRKCERDKRGRKEHDDSGLSLY